METVQRKSKSYTLRFSQDNIQMWNYIKQGKKTVETRAGTSRYQSVQAGDTLILVCDGKKITKRVHKVTHFKTITALLKKYNSELINPGVTELKEMKNMYYSYPGYQEKIAQFGILAFELE